MKSKKDDKLVKCYTCDGKGYTYRAEGFALCEKCMGLGKIIIDATGRTREDKK